MKVSKFLYSLKGRVIYVLYMVFFLSASCATVQPDQAKPTLFLIGDSTVKNGRGDGAGGLWGWGNFISTYFDTTSISIQNSALGGTSSRTFQTQGHWDKVLAQVKPGDYVMMQFGHNDSGPLNDTLRARGTIRGNGDESEAIDNLITKQHEVVHSYGWYIRKLIKETEAKGATAIVLSPVPRNTWAGGNAGRNDESYGKWAAEAAEQENAFFIHLNKLIADRYEQEGEEQVRNEYFNTTDHTHTIEAGAQVNAEAVVEGIRGLRNLKLNKYLSKQGRKVGKG